MHTCIGRRRNNIIRLCRHSHAAYNGIINRVSIIIIVTNVYATTITAPLYTAAVNYWWTLHCIDETNWYVLSLSVDERPTVSETTQLTSKT